MVAKQLMTSANEHWMTPELFLRLIYKFSKIGLDPCSHQNSYVKSVKTFIFPDNDGLEESWGGYGLVYCNPPYGRKLAKWIIKCVVEAARGSEIILLIPARTDTRGWQRWIFPTAKRICFVAGRLEFVDGRDPSATKNKATFPSAVIYFGPNPEKFEEIFQEIGKVITP